MTTRLLNNPALTSKNSVKPVKRSSLAYGLAPHYIPPMSIPELGSEALISWPPSGMMPANTF
jgi:hypothetical protein